MWSRKRWLIHLLKTFFFPQVKTIEKNFFPYSRCFLCSYDLWTCHRYLTTSLRMTEQERIKNQKYLWGCQAAKSVNTWHYHTDTSSAACDDRFPYCGNLLRILCGLRKGFSNLALLTFWTRWPSVMVGPSVPCGMFSNIFGLYSLNARSTPWLSIITLSPPTMLRIRNVSRYFHTLPGGKITWGKVHWSKASSSIQW